MTAKGYFVTCEVGDCICELISRKLSDDEFEHLTYQDIADRLNKLTKENEQLKERNERQAKQLDNLYTLIEKQDWKTLKGLIQEFQECEEQLQREWRTYE